MVALWRSRPWVHWKFSWPPASCDGWPRSWMKPTLVVSSRKCSFFSRNRRSSSVVPTLPSSRPRRWPIGKRVPRTESWDVIPDLAVEVISQSNSADEVAGKIEEYLRAGTRQVWVVYPATSKVQVYDSPTQVKILQVGDDLQGDPLIPGFRLPLAVLFGEGAGD